MFINEKALKDNKRAQEAKFEGVRDIRSGYLFEVNGSIIGDREGLVWFKALDGESSPFQVYYGGTIGDLRSNMYVKIERNPKQPARWQIKEFNRGFYFDDQSGYEQLPAQIPAKEDYEWPPGYPGAKALNIFPRAITDFACRPTSPASMKVRISPGLYPGSTYYAKFTGPINSKDFTSDIPGTSGMARLAAISIDSSGTLNYYNGSTFVDELPMPDAALPDVPIEEMFLTAIRLVNGMTSIQENNFNLELRPLFGNSGGAMNKKVYQVWESDLGAVALQADASGNIGIGIDTPDKKVEILATSTQLRLTHTDASKFADLTVDTNHDLTIKPSDVGQIKLQPTTDSVDFFQVLDADDGTPVLNVDSTNERVGIGNAAPTYELDVAGDIGLDQFLYHNDDPDTYFQWTDDQLDLFVGGLNILRADEAASDTLYLGDVTGGGDVDVNINSGQVFVEGSSGFLAVGTTSPQEIIHAYVSGAIADMLLESDSDAQGGRLFFKVPSNSSSIVGFHGPSYAAVSEYQNKLVIQTFSADIALSAYNTGDEIHFYTGGRTSAFRRMTLDGIGQLGLRVSSPQGIFHIYRAVSGFLVWEYDGLNATVQTIIPNGAGDCLYRLHADYVLRDSAGSVASGTTDVSNSASVNLTVGSNTVRLRVNADGSIDTSRTAGTDTIKVAYTLRWL